MADKQQDVTLHRSFAYTDAKGNQYYFTRQNQHLIGEVMPKEHLQAYADGGLIEFGDRVEIPEPGPTVIPERAAAAPKAPAVKGGIQPSNVTTKER